MATRQQTIERAKLYTERLASIAASCRDHGRASHELSLTDIEAIAVLLATLATTLKGSEEPGSSG
jgi:hypothetical protein